MKISKEIATQIVAEQEAANKKINQLRKEAYEKWVAEGGKDAANKIVATKRAADRAIRYSTKNGLTIKALQDAGVKVDITHTRYTNIGGAFRPQFIQVPSYLRDMYSFSPCGGSTHIRLRKADGSWIGVASFCDPRDAFDYKKGVRCALNQLSQEEADELLNTAEISESICAEYRTVEDAVLV